MKLKSSFKFDQIQVQRQKINMSEYFNFMKVTNAFDSPSATMAIQAGDQLLDSLKICNFEQCADSIIIDKRVSGNPPLLLSIIDAISLNRAFRCYPKLEIAQVNKGKHNDCLAISDKNNSWFHIQEFNTIAKILCAFIELSIMKAYEACNNGSRAIEQSDHLYIRLRTEIPVMVEKHPKLLGDCRDIVRNTIMQHNTWKAEVGSAAELKLKEVSRERHMFILVYLNHNNPDFGGYNQPDNLIEQLYVTLDDRHGDGRHLNAISQILSPDFKTFGRINNFIMHSILQDWASVINNLKIESMLEDPDSDTSMEKKKKKKKKKKTKGKGKKADEEVDTPVPTANLQLSAGLTPLELNEPNFAFLKNASGILTPPDSQNHQNTQSGTQIGTVAGATTQAEETKSSNKKLEASGKQAGLSEDQQSGSNTHDHLKAKTDLNRNSNSGKADLQAVKKNLFKSPLDGGDRHTEDEQHSTSFASHFGELDKVYCASLGESEFGRGEHLNKSRKNQNPDKILRKQSFNHDETSFKSTDMISHEYESRQERFLSTEPKIKQKDFDLAQMKAETLKLKSKTAAVEQPVKNYPQDPELAGATIVANAQGMLQYKMPGEDLEYEPVKKDSAKQKPFEATSSTKEGSKQAGFAKEVPAEPKLSHSQSQKDEPPMPVLTSSLSSPPLLDAKPKQPKLKKVESPKRGFQPAKPSGGGGSTRIKLKKVDKPGADEGNSDPYKRKNDRSGWNTTYKERDDKKPYGVPSTGGSSHGSSSAYSKKTEEPKLVQSNYVESRASTAPGKPLAKTTGASGPVSGATGLKDGGEKKPIKDEKVHPFNGNGLGSTSSGFTPKINSPQSPPYEMLPKSKTGSEVSTPIKEKPVALAQVGASPLTDAQTYLNQQAKRLVSDMKTFSDSTELNRRIARKRVEAVMKMSFDLGGSDEDNPVELKSYGSAETGLIIPDSDIDLLITTKEGCFPKENCLEILELMEQNLATEPWVVKVNLLKAAVPVLKIEIDVSKRLIGDGFKANIATAEFMAETNQIASRLDHGGVPVVQKVDLTVETEETSALQTTAYVKSSVTEYPEMFELSLLLKIFLNSQELNKPYHGGMSGYSSALLIVAWLEYCKKMKKNYNGNIYLNFRDMVEFYGKIFNAAEQVICTKKFWMLSSPNWPYLDPKILGVDKFYVYILDPVPDYPKNVAPGAYNFQKVQEKLHALSHELRKEEELYSVVSPEAHISSDYILKLFRKV